MKHSVLINFIIMFARALSTKASSFGVLSFSLVSSLAKKKSTCSSDGTTKLAAATTTTAATSILSLKDNALLKRDGLPLFNEIDPKQVVPAIEFDLNNLKQNFQGT